MKTSANLLLMILLSFGCTQSSELDTSEYRRLYFRYLGIHERSSERLQSLRGQDRSKARSGLRENMRIKRDDLRRLSFEVNHRNEFQGKNDVGDRFLEVILLEVQNLDEAERILASDLPERTKSEQLDNNSQHLRAIYDRYLPRLMQDLDIPMDTKGLLEQV